MSNLIKYAANAARIVQDEWQTVLLPPSGEAERKQAGKVVLFKLTGEKTASEQQITATEIPASGKVLIPLSVWLVRKDMLNERVKVGEVGVWLETHELLEQLVESQADLSVFPLIAIHVERFADGRIFLWAPCCANVMGIRTNCVLLAMFCVTSYFS